MAYRHSRTAPESAPSRAIGGRAAALFALLGGVLLIAAPAIRADADYLRDIKPLLRDRCGACHGALKQKAGLRLDTAASIRAGGESGPAIQPGRPAESLLVRRVSAAEVGERMPPEHEGEPLKGAQIELLRAWIDAGAPAPDDERPEADPKDHWAFRPVVRPALPAITNRTWIRNPIDAFIARHQEESGLRPQPEASRPVLLRRLHFDLVGLPPTVAELEAVSRDPAPDWYERAVVRLLGDPRHGERWARHWMDIWRYSDPWGLGDQLRNSQRHLWHWRDWIVESLNRDLGYDEMLRLMLAADETHPNDPGRLRATGFLVRNYFLFNRHQWLDETVEHVGKGLLGLTLNCAKCHDHKYDPFAQTDYYRLRAFFEPYHARLDLVPGETDLTRDGLPRAWDRTLDPPTYRFIRGQETVPDKSVLIRPGVPALLAFAEPEIKPVPLPPEAWQPERHPWVLPAYREAARSKLDAARLSLAAAAGDDRTPADLAVVAAEAELASVDRRIDATRARWNGEGANSAPHRAAVRAEREAAVARARHALAELELRALRAPAERKESLVKEAAAARQRLDEARRSAGQEPGAADVFTPLIGAAWTATRFLDSTKDDPSLEFLPESTGRRTALARWITDPRNPLTARVAVNHVWARHFGTPLAANVFDLGRKSGEPVHADLIDWLASEFVAGGWSLRHLHELIVSSATYRMSSSMAGAEANLAHDPDNLRWWRRTPIRLEAQVVRDAVLAQAGWLDGAIGGPPVPPAAQDESRRRSLYFQHSFIDRNPLLAVFDDATVKECYRREQSVVPQQALALFNSRLVHAAAAPIAARLSREPGVAADDTVFVRQAFLALPGFIPGEAECTAAEEALRTWRRERSSGAVGVDPRALLVWALINHHDFVTLR